GGGVAVAAAARAPPPADKLFQDGHGLANVRDRIATLYGHRGGLGVGVRAGGGTKVILLMPQQPPWTAGETAPPAAEPAGAGGTGDRPEAPPGRDRQHETRPGPAQAGPRRT